MKFNQEDLICAYTVSFKKHVISIPNTHIYFDRIDKIFRTKESAEQYIQSNNRQHCEEYDLELNTRLAVLFSDGRLALLDEPEDRDAFRTFDEWPSDQEILNHALKKLTGRELDLIREGIKEGRV